MKKVILGFIVFIISLSLTLLFLNNKKALTDQATDKEVISLNKQIEVEEILVTDEDTIKPIKLLITGDVSTSGLTVEYMVETGATPFQFVENYFNTADIVLVNSEMVLAEEEGYPQNKPYTLRGPVDATMNAFTNANVSIVSIANNHSSDFGPDAFVNMLDIFEENNLKYFGGGRTVSDTFSAEFIELNDTVIAFIGVNESETFFTSVNNNRAGGAYFNESLLKPAFDEAKLKAGIIIVMPHWGIEHQPTSNSFQQEWAHKFIDWGADLVVGSHPHIIQESEYYQDTPIYYSLGNFVFSGFSWIETGQVGLLLEVEIENDEIKSINEYKVELTYQGFPKFIDGSMNGNE
ncbi:MAG: CapA family protein [Candidatus Dojkabacteria bacterium]|nr:CapA family protein [Candidatus Dojkabacteria bacterium]MDQ7021068.1 CapA family protein [Candidatus Dojkabacteria bacterium]